jgi:hypothetical protein
MTSSLGKLGEAYAAAYLTQLGYTLVAANFTLPVGRNLRGAVVNAEIGIEDNPHRYDVVTVVLNNDSTPQIELLRNFWTEASLRKRRRHFDPLYFA